MHVATVTFYSATCIVFYTHRCSRSNCRETIIRCSVSNIAEVGRKCYQQTWTMTMLLMTRRVPPRAHCRGCDHRGGWTQLLDIKAPSTPGKMSKQYCRMLQVERFFRQSRNKLSIFNLFRFCRKDEILPRKLVRHCCQKRQQCRSNV